MAKRVTNIVLTNDVLSTENVIGLISHPKCGGVSLFVGTTRDHHYGKSVVKLEYECYKNMAEKEIEKICNEIRTKWPDIQGIAVHHRLGHVPVMNASVIIGISSPHRKDALDATQYCIDALKTTVPIWKKEVYKDGSNEWLENKECGWRMT